MLEGTGRHRRFRRGCGEASPGRPRAGMRSTARDPAAGRALGPCPRPGRGSGRSLLLADFPERADRQLLVILAADPRAPVRWGAALSIGLGQFKSLIPSVMKRINDVAPVAARTGPAVPVVVFSQQRQAAGRGTVLHHAC